MTRVYRYILAHDGKIAPCPEDGQITLGTCKPVIRRCAKPGDWVAGFKPGSAIRGLLLWAGRVDRILNHGDYQKQFPERTDAVYALQEDGLNYQRLDPDYHPSHDEMRRDLSGPVLLFDPEVSVYLDGVPVAVPDNLMHLAPAGRGHRVNGLSSEDVRRFESWVGNLKQGQTDEFRPDKSNRHPCAASRKAPLRASACGRC